MLDVSLPATVTRERMQPDLRPLHSALSQAESILDVLQICEATAMAYGGGMWVAACLKPEPRTYVTGPGPIAQDRMKEMLGDMAQTARAGALDPGAGFEESVTVRWRSDKMVSARSALREFAQVELSLRGALYGLLRVTRSHDQAGSECDWETVESIMCAGAPYVVMCLQRESAGDGADPVTGLSTTTGLTSQVEREVQRVRNSSLEFALVVMALRMGDGRGSDRPTDAELRAIGRVVQRTLRESDSACYMADGRLALLLPMTSQRNALIATARLTDQLRACPDLPDDLGCQIGICGWPSEGPCVDMLFERALEALADAEVAGARGAFVSL